MTKSSKSHFNINKSKQPKNTTNEYKARNSRMMKTIVLKKKKRQNPLQYCKVISLQLIKITEKKKPPYIVSCNTF